MQEAFRRVLRCDDGRTDRDLNTRWPMIEKPAYRRTLAG